MINSPDGMMSFSTHVLVGVHQDGLSVTNGLKHYLSAYEHGQPFERH